MAKDTPPVDPAPKKKPKPGLQSRPPWKKGESGNPAGRPKGSKNKMTLYREIADLIPRDKATGKVLTTALGNVIRKNGMSMEELLVIKHFEVAKNGDIRAIESIMDNLYGKTKEVHEITGKDGAPLQTQNVNVEAKKQYSSEELAQLYRDALKTK